MTRAHAPNRADDGAVYETEAAAVSVRPRQVEEDRSALEYAVETDHPAPVRVRVRQPLPESIAIEDLGFPGDCGEDWERDGDALLFEREVDPETTVRTAWGVDGELSAELGPPTVEAEPISIELEDDFELDEELLAADAVEPEGDSGEDGPTDAGGDASEETANGAESVPELDLDDPEAGSADGEESAAAAESDAAGGSSALESPAELEDLATAPDDDDEISIPTTEAAGEEATTADHDATASDGTDADGPTDAADDPDVGGEATEGTADGDGTVEDGATAEADASASDPEADDEAAANATDSLVHELVEELHGEEVDEGHRDALADALEVRLSESTNAFVEHVRARQRRRAERIEDDLEALEESVDGLYGLKADAGDVTELKRAITGLDDAKASDGDVRELRSRLQDLAESSVDEDVVATLRADHEALVADLEATEADLAAHRDEGEAERASIREEIGAVSTELDDLAERSASEERLETVADDLATLRDAAATEAALTELEETVGGLEADAATRTELAELRSEVESVEARLDERVDLLADRHDELVADSATDEALASLREDHRAKFNEQTSQLQALEDTLEAEYSTDDELADALDRRVHRSLAHLLAFAVGAVGLAVTVPLAVAGSPAAAATFLGGAGTLGLWWRAVGRAGLERSNESLLERLR